MAIDLRNETVQTFPQAAKLFPIPPHISSLVRWAKKGIRGTRLEYGRAGRKLITTVEAVERFCNTLAQADQPVEAPAPPARRPSPSRRQKQIEQAEAYCTSKGI